MGHRIRHCVECPKCLTRYLVACSPYRNGSYLVPTVAGSREEYTLYCSCGRPPVSSRWRWEKVKTYEVSKIAYDRGYGTPGEILPISNQSWDAWSFDVARHLNLKSGEKDGP
jgi:hypothetical protein